MAERKIQILTELKIHLQNQLGDEIKDVILFGSQSTGQASAESDYDFLILLKKKPDWRLKREISDICYDIDLKYNIISDTHLLAETELNTLRGKQPIFQNAITRGIYA